MDEVFLRYLDALNKTQWLPPENLADYQRGLVQQLVWHAHSESPFYAERLACLVTDGGEIDLSRWNQVPILTRADATVHSEAMRVSSLPETLGTITDLKTSGSDGVPLSFTVNALARLAYNGAFTRLAHWHDADITSELAQIRIYRHGVVPQYPDGMVSKGWSWAAPDAVTYGLDLRTPVNDQIDWLLRHRCPYLVTLPSNAMALAYAASPEVARMLDLKIIFSISETIIPGARELIASKLGAKLVGIYS